MLIQRHGHGAEREDSREENERAAIHGEVLLNSLLKNLVCPALEGASDFEKLTASLKAMP
jgi:hypothetical protein